MFHVYIGLGFLYLLWRFVWPLPCRAQFKWLISPLLLVASQYHLIQIQLFGTMFSPEWPRWQVILWGWAFCSFVLLIVVTLLNDVLTLTLRLVGKGKPRRQRSPHRYVTMAVIACALSALGVHNAIKIPNVRQLEISLPNWPKDLDGLKVIQLTDLHISRLFNGPWTQAVVAKVNALHPDLILMTGDFIDGTTTARADDVAPLANLQARYGRYGVLGNHEYYFDAEAWKKQLEALGLIILSNEHSVINISGNQVTLAGVNDESAPQFGLPGPDTDLALRDAPKSAPIILLKHRPVGALLAEQLGTSLQLSGHTHGGMIWGLNQLAKYANQGFISGLYRVSTMQLYVSNGTALWNGFPIRLGVPAEITEFTIHHIE